MGYYEFKINIADESKDALIEHLSANGCIGIVEYNGNIVAYFPDNIGINKITGFIQSAGQLLKRAGLDNRLYFDFTLIEERDWNESWKENFRPIKIGKKLAVIPPWEQMIKERINLVIDPAMAFGTGHHETTRTCLMLIERFSIKYKKERFLDIGTGTGILAIAASMLGYRDVIGVDTDPLSIEAAQGNIALNHLSNVNIKHGSISVVEGIYDAIAANLMSEILIEIADEIASRLDRNGYAVLSGMIEGQETEVIKAMQKAGLNVIEKVLDDKWVSIALIK